MSKNNQHEGKQSIYRLGQGDSPQSSKRKVSLNINIKKRVGNEMKKIYDSLGIRPDKESLYSSSNLNKKGIVKLTIANIDLQKIRGEGAIQRIKTMGSIRNKSQINQRRWEEKKEQVCNKNYLKKEEYQEERNEKYIENEQQFILRPTKEREKSVIIRQSTAYNILFRREKEKVVIFSSSQASSTKQGRKKAKVGLKLNQQQKLNVEESEQTQKRRKTKEKEMKVEIQQQMKRQTLKCIQKDIKIVDIESFIEMDRRILNMYPKIDLEILLGKIKKEQHYRKMVSIQKWQHFNPFNLNLNDYSIQNIN